MRQVFPGGRRQRCQVHKLRNILAKLPRLAATTLKPLIQQVFLAPDHRKGLRRGRALIARFRERYPSAMECLEKDLEECLTYLLFPVEHGKRIRTTNLLERTFGESRRRTKVIPRFPGERSCLALVFAVLMTASAKWRSIRMTPKILRIGFLDEDILSFQDWDTAIRLAKHHTFGFLPRATFIYDCRNPLTISKNAMRTAAGDEQVVSKHRRAILCYCGPKALACHYNQAAGLYREANEIARDRRCERLAVMLWPFKQKLAYRPLAHVVRAVFRKMH